ncbi:hypothetical protein [uncultured Campylobacter sp.]|uniref:hypothetical protein n=1 Tax=uncultured Campylobacter sp. TaxID=218934 RepID=UPI002604C6AA|nr:hypothetical protein [uncultured Campylobacter sp.]
MWLKILLEPGELKFKGKLLRLAIVAEIFADRAAASLNFKATGFSSSIDGLKFSAPLAR